jgi:hypothetical protein
MVGACHQSSRTVPPPPRGPLDASVAAAEAAGVAPLPVALVAAGVEPPLVPLVAAGVVPVDAVVDAADGVSLSDELPQAASRAAMAGALSPSATARLRTVRRLIWPVNASSINL